MKYKKYIDSLSSMEDSFEEGMLSQLREEPPEELHGHIMKSIGREKKKRIFLNYKTYVPAIAAVFIFAIILSGVNGNNDINSIIKNKTPEKIGTADIASADNNTNVTNNIGNQTDTKQETADKSSSSTVAKESINVKSVSGLASQDSKVKEKKSESNVKNDSTASTGTTKASSGKTTLDSLADKNKNTTDEGGDDSNTANSTPSVLEQNKKVLGLMTEFNAVATENNNTYKIAIYEFDKLQKKIVDEGIENSVLTVLGNDGQYVTFKLNIR